MFALKNRMIFLLLCYSGCMQAMNFDHVQKNHCLSDTDRSNVIKNSDNGVISAICLKTTGESRKTIFPENMQGKNSEDVLLYAAKHGALLFLNKQVKSKSISEYRQHHVNNNIVIGVVQNKFTNHIPTVFPVLRYISWEEQEKLDPLDKVYIASCIDEKQNILQDVYATVANIQNMSRDGVFLAHRNLGQNRNEYLVDISQYFTHELFYGKKEERGSILVVTNWIRKRA